MNKARRFDQNATPIALIENGRPVLYFSESTNVISPLSSCLKSFIFETSNLKCCSYILVNSLHINIFLSAKYFST